MELRKVDEIIERYKGKSNPIIEIMQDVQRECRYLPRDILFYISKKTGTPLSHIHHIATFYRAFSLKEKGRHHVTVCMGTACHVKGARYLLEEFERKLEIESGDTTPDKSFSLETVNCLGTCAISPVVVVDGARYASLYRAATHIRWVIRG